MTLKRVHLIAATAGLLTILTFWISTVTVELFGSESLIITVKQTIPWGLLVLVPALAITGATGFSMSGASSEPRIRAKRRRMPFISANGLLILIPTALYLDRLASRGELGGAFYAVQALELITGAVNLTLMSLNARDGLRLTGRLTNARADAP
ncbi:hypothetical protein [Actinomadura sp. HBU206391]|uniref:hypothetical protein n=1 Tax=Actinomadura sp. HBU206391 TaxID=2731692 RepID=UPI0016500A3A|nr:hypothetical protein [Actinomadura sp. HBU206391]MBC6459892.1 hypothetical protein [Actinomadura sp. HBU206391]